MPSFILAAGESVRFEGGYPKQHIEIDGERVIDRIFRQFGNPYLVTHRDDIAPTYRKRLRPELREFTAETFRSTNPYWGADNLIIFGDVYFTEEAAQSINKCKWPTAFFTDGQDIFAVKFQRREVSNLVPALNIAIALARTPDGNCGRIWEVYRALYGLEAHPILPSHNKQDVFFIGDRTQDFDTVEDLENFRAGKTKNFILAGVNP